MEIYVMKLHEEKQLHMMMLDTFMIDVQNNFDYMADKAIEQLKNENAKSWEAYNASQAKENANVDRTA